MGLDRRLVDALDDLLGWAQVLPRRDRDNLKVGGQEADQTGDEGPGVAQGRVAPSLAMVASPPPG